MISFFVCLAILILGYFIYGGYVESCFRPPIDDRKTPAYRLEDGVDYVPMGTGRVFLIQLLNIAGLGPIFGALAGAMWGPAVFLWITFGTVFAGGVHDFISGLLSERNDGASISEIVGKYLGDTMRHIMRGFSVILLILVGVAFTTGPAGLLTKITTQSFNFWLVVLLIYYFIATFLPIDKVIGKLYPFFGFCLIFMAVGVGTMLFVKGYTIPEISFTNMHPKGTPIWPIMFITVACGAISGFHSTQSPLMARCIKSERECHKIFYGAMVCEGIIALIWAAAGTTFYDGTQGLAKAFVTYKGAGGVVYDICSGLMGTVGTIIAMIGVIACPVSSADTAFRSARYTICDWFKIDQHTVASRLKLSIPIIAVGGILTQVDVTILWRYFSWTNQTLAVFVLWAGAMYLLANKGNYVIALVPGTFMSAVSCTYILMAKEGLGLSTSIAYPAGIAVAVIANILFWKRAKKVERGEIDLADKPVEG
ncbi:carbon starvation CstA family protein [Acidaminococcus intestini]|uniref:carbon starvation CstA family protein n=1 Tax=Acidaminococcus intestini TaxID=187327 RepID=UPI00265D4614|nr:carbon starvation CstA family protein [Acidaminococcus intestini]